MCNLYSMTRAPEAVLRLFRVPHNRAAAFAPFDAVFPGRTAPIVRRAADGERELVAMSWGFVLPQGAKAARRVTNFRDDKTRESPFWRDSFAARRCLVPVTAFAEPAEVTPATWHWFALRPEAAAEPAARAAAGDAAAAARPLFAFAGIWRRWSGPLRQGSGPVALETFAFMTTTPNALVSTINHERMPVVLDGEAACRTWLDGDAASAFALARQHPAEAMRIVQAGFEKRDMLGAATAAPPARLL